MKKLLVLSSLLLIGLFSFSQKTFTDKQEAIRWLKETFAAHLIKEVSYKGGTYTAELTFSDDFMIFSTTIKKPFKGENELNVGETDSLNLADSFTCGQFKAAPGKLAVTCSSWSQKEIVYKTAYIPFEFPKGSELMLSIQEAFAIITKQNLEEWKVREKELKDAKFMKEIAENAKIVKELLPGITVFNSDSLQVNLLDYLKKNRTFNDKPTLVVTWANWCPPCMSHVDLILKDGLASSYNILLVNKDFNSNISKLKVKVAEHTPDYSKEVRLLFDNANQMEPIDKGGAPYFIWLDDQFVIKGSFAGYNIKLDAIKKVLLEIE